MDDSGIGDSAPSMFENPPTETFDTQLSSVYSSFAAVMVQPELRASSRNAAVGGASKRVFDIIVALFGLILCAPLLMMIAALIKMMHGGPVIFRHSRVGFEGKEFPCFKFRTMVNNANDILARHLATDSEAAREWAEMQKLTNDPRLTSLGFALRKTSLDELPQLFNILKGDMSLVGPRPIVPAEMQRYGAYLDDYLQARPGLTGAWQVSGRNDVEYSGRVQLDHEYVHNWSFRRDVAIMIKTVPIVLRGYGCY